MAKECMKPGGREGYESKGGGGGGGKKKNNQRKKNTG